MQKEAHFLSFQIILWLYELGVNHGKLKLCFCLKDKRKEKKRKEKREN